MFCRCRRKVASVGSSETRLHINAPICHFPDTAGGCVWIRSADYRAQLGRWWVGSATAPSQKQSRQSRGGGERNEGAERYFAGIAESMALRLAAERCCVGKTATRSFATAASKATAASASHDPPLKLYGIPARYANATYSAASKAGELEIVQRDLDAFQHIIRNNANFKAYLTNPTVSRSAKVEMVDKAFDAKSKTSSVTKNLLLAMAGNARLADAEKVIDAYTRMLKAKKGEIDAIVTTAEPLTPQQEKALAAGLKAQIGANETIVLKTEVNPALVGGLTVQIGDKFMDLSISSKIASMKTLMQDSVAS
ncbi:ATP synthase O subunit, mitochondrial precursor [Ectocarpus siliculosus]|uniref:ATP synthase O subunit, mitochondrial n=1 Tax=Ectocarpus siliculosus TaxID=2880 RepID=D7FJT6_ECTSI|nr:ATP synthase O subunit, mitochondrial precursor [Ectocarpus siliculosus]|eukprot:CBJ29188.1 ATP synthase O subunit, mitochondrial precursor [Ectocarpus siliculosus]